MKYFWTHKDNIPEGAGYGQFSVKHFLWIAASAVFTAAFVFFYSSADASGKLLLLRSVSAVLIIIEIIKMILIRHSDVKFSDYLPLEICSFAAYFIIFDSISPHSSTVGQMLVTLFLPAAIMAVLVPTSSVLPAINFYTIHQFVYHALIIAYISARFFCGEIVMTYPGVWLSIIYIMILAAFVYVIDCIFDKDFMFLRDPYGNPLLQIIWNRTGGGFAYTGGLVCFCIVMIHIFYVFFQCIYILFIH